MRITRYTTRSLLVLIADIAVWFALDLRVEHRATEYVRNFKDVNMNEFNFNTQGKLKKITTVSESESTGLIDRLCFRRNMTIRYIAEISLPENSHVLQMTECESHLRIGLLREDVLKHDETVKSLKE